LQPEQFKGATFAAEMYYLRKNLILGKKKDSTNNKTYGTALNQHQKVA